MMAEDIDAFLREVRQLPKFIEAARSDEKWSEHLNDMETGIQIFAESDEPHVIEIFDQILKAVIANKTKEAGVFGAVGDVAGASAAKIPPHPAGVGLISG
jgi:hypothetical protein